MNTEILQINITDDDFKEKIIKASNIIKSGGLVIFPTETVYGLGADATNSDAAMKIYAAKGRPSDNPLIIHIDTPEMAEKYAYANDTYYKLANRFMPGPLTVVLKAKDTVPMQTRGGLDTVAVRCPENMIARSLIAASGIPIAAPSANLSGTPSPTNVQHVIDDMYGRVDMIIDGGPSDFGLESTIVKIEKDGGMTLLRPGKITVEDLKNEVANISIAEAVTGSLPSNAIAISPGMKYRHYAPKAEFELLDYESLQEAIEYIKRDNISNIAILAYDEDIFMLKSEVEFAHYYSFGSINCKEDQAKRLFAVLRDADKRGFDKIYAPLPKIGGVGLAIYNRMIRAASHRIVKLK